LYSLREDVCRFGELAADDVGVDAQGDRRVGVPPASGDDMDWSASQLVIALRA
jgi:hypothetical protein